MSRPYGISYDGKPCLRQLTRFTAHFPSEDLSPQSCPAPENVPGRKPRPRKSKKATNEPLQSSNPPIESEKEDKEANQPQLFVDALIKEDLCYVQRFLNFGAGSNPICRVSKKRDASEEGLELGKNLVERICRADWLNLELEKEKDKFECSCGKEYRKRQRLKIHISMYEGTHWESTGKQSNRERKRKSIGEIDTNWLGRIVQLHKAHPPGPALKCLQTQLNPSLSSQSALLQFSQLCPDCHPARQSTLIFILSLKQFIAQCRQAEKLWLLKFDSFWLMANVFFAWLSGREHQRLLQGIFVVFAQWCYQTGLTGVFVSRPGRIVWG